MSSTRTIIYCYYILCNHASDILLFLCPFQLDLYFYLREFIKYGFETCKYPIRKLFKLIKFESVCHGKFQVMLPQVNYKSISVWFQVNHNKHQFQNDQLFFPFIHHCNAKPSFKQNLQKSIQNLHYK